MTRPIRQRLKGGILHRVIRRMAGTDKHRQLAFSASGAVIIKTASGLLNYLSFMLLARLMASRSFGEMSFALNVAMFLAVVAGGGLPIAIQRWVPEFAAQPATARFALTWSVRRTLVLALITGAILLIAILLNEVFAAGNHRYMLAAVVLLALLALAEILSSALRSLGSVIWALAPRDVIWRLAICIALIACIALGRTLSSLSALSLQAITLAFIILLQTLHLRSQLPDDTPSTILGSNVKSWRATARPMWLFSIVYAASVYIDLIVLGLYISPGQTGPYFAATKIANILQLFHIAITSVTAPQIAAHYHRNDIVELQAMLRRAVAFVAIPTISLLFVLIVFGKPLLGAFSPNFTSAYVALVLLSVSGTVHTLSGPAGYVLMLSGHEREYLRITIVGYLVGLGIQFLTIPYLNAVGAALGTSASILIWAIWTRHRVRVLIGVDATILSIFAVVQRRQQPPSSL